MTKFSIDQQVKAIVGKGLLIFHLGKIGTIIGFDTNSHYQNIVKFSNGVIVHYADNEIEPV